MAFNFHFSGVHYRPPAMMNQTLYESEIIDFFVSHTESVNFLLFTVIWMVIYRYLELYKLKKI